MLVLLLAVSLHAQTIRVTPQDALADAPIRIRVEGSSSDAEAIVRASTRDASAVEWQSAMPLPAALRDATSLLLFMEADGEGRFNTAGLEQLDVQFTLEVDGKTVATTNVTRRFLGAGVKRSDVRTPAVFGTLFKPAAPRGAVLVIGGSEGGIGDETVASLLASHGYAALAIAYFGEGNLPKELAAIPLETFFAGIDFLEQHSKRVAIVATSKGAEAALLAASRRHDVAAVVAYAPSSVVWSCICDEPLSSWTIDGKPLAFVPAGRDPSYAPPRGTPIEPAVNYRYRLASAGPETHIRVEDIDAPLMFIAGSDDRLWPSADMTRQLAERRRGRAGDVVRIIEGAGHLVAKAVIPAGSTRVGNGRIETGGSAEGNSRGASVVWPEVLRFLAEHARAKPALAVTHDKSGIVIAGERVPIDAGMNLRFTKKQLAESSSATREGLVRWAATGQGRELLRFLTDANCEVFVTEDRNEEGMGRAPQPGIATMVTTSDRSKAKVFSLILNPIPRDVPKAIASFPATTADFLAVTWAAEMLHIYYYARGIVLPHHRRADFQDEWRTVAAQMGFPTVTHDHEIEEHAPNEIFVMGAPKD